MSPADLVGRGHPLRLAVRCLLLRGAPAPQALPGASRSGSLAASATAGEFGFTPSIDSRPDGQIAGPTVYGGRGCLAAGPNAGPDAVAGEPSPPSAGAIPAEPGEEKTVVFSRGGCFFPTKIAAGQDLGYDAVIIGQSHGGTRHGLLPAGHAPGVQRPAPSTRARRPTRAATSLSGRRARSTPPARSSTAGLRAAARRARSEPEDHRLVRGA